MISSDRGIRYAIKYKQRYYKVLLSCIFTGNAHFFLIIVNYITKKKLVTSAAKVGNFYGKKKKKKTSEKLYVWNNQSQLEFSYKKTTKRLGSTLFVLSSC